MKRFYFDDEENSEEDDDLESRFMFPDPSEFITMAQIDNPNQYILNYALKICENSWFWRFYGVSKKIKMVASVFEELKNLTEGSQDA
jgi:hypothetical protein